VTLSVHGISRSQFSSTLYSSTDAELRHCTCTLPVTLDVNCLLLLLDRKRSIPIVRRLGLFLGFLSSPGHIAAVLSNTIIDCIVLLHGQNEPLFDSEINRQTSDTPTHPSRHRLPSPCRNDRDGKRPSSDGFRPVIIRLNNVSKTMASSVPDCNSRSLRFYHMKTAERDKAVLSCDPQRRHHGVFSDHESTTDC